MTTWKSGKTKTDSWSSSWDKVLWLPFNTEVRLESEVWNSPVTAGRTPLPGGGDAGIGDAGMDGVMDGVIGLGVDAGVGGAEVGDVGCALGSEVVTSRRAAASESLSSVMSRSQSDLPVEITIWVCWHTVEKGVNSTYLTVVRLNTPQHVGVHVHVEATRVRFMA